MTRSLSIRLPSRVPAVALPARVAAAIRTQQDSSERLIGWTQLAIVVLFGTLYAVSPKSFKADVPFEPVPLVLGIYFVFTVGRLLIALRGRLPGWLLYVSVVVDMALLFGLIWSFHLQYQQPPSFYLKAPSLLYVFIFIVLRALRFEVRFVVFAGLVGALGWIALVAYAVVFQNGLMVTRDYVQYATSNAILIGAEIDKIASILTVTAVLAVAIARARALLVRAATEGSAARELARFFAPAIADHIRAAPETLRAGEGAARTAAILYCDMRGFTQLSNALPPDRLMALLADYQARVVPVIGEAGGTIDKFLGDGILAGFGALAETPTYAADALRAATAIVAAIEAWNETRIADGETPIRVGVAVTVGRIVAGAVGDASRLEYTVIGEPVNLAAKLEKHTKVEGVRAIATAAAFDVAAAQGYTEAAVERRPRRVVEGVADPVDLVVLAA